MALQFREHKGDLIENENHQKNNCQIAKLVYVHEGVEPEAPKSKRYRLINLYYFSSICDGKGNEEFWDEIYEYLVRLTSHMKDSTEDARQELREAIRKKTKAEFCDIVERLMDALPEGQRESGMKRLQESRDYILSNWKAARIRLLHKEGVVGSSTEGHVSHVLSSRMSSRPMGWSKKGAGKMAQLRAYYYNKGNMLELVRYQKTELPKAAGCEKDIILSTKMFSSERNRHGELGKYADILTHSVSLDTKKKVYFNEHIWGL